MFKLGPKASNFKNKGKAANTMDADMSYRCGAKDHWSRVFQATSKIVAGYHSRRRKFESNFAQVEEIEDTKMEVSNFQEAFFRWKIRFLEMGPHTAKFYPPQAELRMWPNLSMFFGLSFE